MHEFTSGGIAQFIQVSDCETILDAVGGKKQQRGMIRAVETK
jgi:hypothetical protein